MAEFIAEYDGIYGESLLYIQDVFPGNGFDLFVDFIGILGVEVFDGFQNTDGSAQAEICFVHHFLITGE